MQPAKIVPFAPSAPAAPKRAKRQHKAANRIEPKFVKIGGKDYWRVRLGSRVTKQAQPIQKYFRSKIEADTFIRQQVVLLQNQGTAAFSLSDSQRVAAVHAIRQLAEVGATLGEAVEYFLKHAKPVGGVTLFKVGTEAFIQNRREFNCKPRYIRNLESQANLLQTIAPKKEEAPFEARPINEIKKKDLERWLAFRGAAEEWSPKTRNNYIITLRAMWKFFTDEKWCAENVATAINKSLLDDVPTVLFTPDEARKLLCVAMRCFDGEMLPGIAIGLFGGLRRSEICELDWSEVKAGFIEVKAAKAKTRKRRAVQIQPNLAKWLDPFRAVSGPVVRGNEDWFEEKRKHLASEAKLTWARNVLRHSAASYHLAGFGDENSTALQMGHSPQVLFDHYRELVTPEAAAEFWAIEPESTLEDAESRAKFPGIEPKI